MKGRRFAYLAVAVFAVAGVLLLAGPAGASRQVHATAATNVHCGDTINASITLNGDLDCSGYSGTALTFTTSGVTLDLGGHTITGNPSYAVVYANGVDNNTLQNGTIDGGDYGAELEYAHGDTVQNMTIKNTAEDGVYFYYDTNTLITNNTFTNADDAIEGYYGASNYISNNVITKGAYGIYVEYEQQDTFSSNVENTDSSEAYSDYYSNGDNWTGNVSTAAGTEGFYIEMDGYGYVNVINNAARNAQGSEGFYTYGNFNSPYEDWYGITPPYSTFSGNQSNYNVGYGFYSEYDWAATFTGNSAKRNGDDGFYFEYPANMTITSNTANLNNGDGFYVDTYEEYYIQTFSNNSAMYNTSYGFEGGSYGVPGSGNAGGGTNSSGDCYLVAGCS